MLITSILLSSLLAQPAAPAATPPVTIVRGHFDHAPAGDTVRILYGLKRENTVKTVLDPQGNFQLRLPMLKQPTGATLLYARQNTALYLTPGDELTVSLDFPRFDETIRYTGRGANANNYLAQSLYKFEFGPAGDVPRPMEQRTPATTPAELRQMVDARRKAQLAFLQTYAKAHPLPADFQQLVKRRLDIRRANALMEYPAYYRGVNHRPAPLPADYYNFLRDIPATALMEQMSGDTGENSVIAQLLWNYTLRLLPNDSLATDPAEARRIYALATQDLGRTATRDQAMSMLLMNQLPKTLAGVEAAYPVFRAENQDSTLARELRTQLVKRRNIQPGRPAPAFRLQDHTGQPVALSELRGKVVYLDFWGTWCKPCMGEMPASLALRQRFTGRDVVFVYLSAGDKTDKWQRVLQEQHLTGPGSVHLRIGPEDEVLLQTYQVSSFPTYWIIGRDGSIVQPNAPRPSQETEVVAALEKALR